MKYIYTILLFLVVLFSSAESDYWEEVTDITPFAYVDSYWLDVYFLPSNLNYGWVCGRDARVIRTTDRGKSWKGVTLPSTEHLESVHFTTQNIGYVSGVDGIWKSEDGGVNWTNITPTDTLSYWGCYFWDSNNGVVIGDGCMDYHQYFWHTTDGGNSWTQFQGDEPNSGLTDAIIINPNTEAYAVSSGRLWISYDGGRSWEVKDTTGTTVWHEEICKFANSFLIPTSGSTCSGGGSAGGMRFSTNGGASWTDRPAPRGPMYGTFLINQARGWACGLYGQVLYTDDAGQSWREMSCGLDNSHLDDIRFLSEDEGWVVGQGLYRLAQNKFEISESPVIFPDMCLPGYVDKTIYIENKSFNSNIAEFNILGLDKDDFTLMMPNNQVSLESCEVFPLTIRFEPSALGEKNAILRCEFTGAVMKEIPLQAFALEPSLIVDSTTVVINPAYCGLDNSGYLELGSVTRKDTIESYTKKNGSSDIRLVTTTPIGINMGAALSFLANPRDTGWVEAEYLMKLKPCENDTVFKVRAYGVSPIINSPLTMQKVIACTNKGEMLIPISNTGNADLDIPTIDFIGNNPNYNFMGFKSGNTFPLSIPPGEADTLIIELAPQDFGLHKEILHIVNNDSTRARGQKNPLIVELQYEYSTPLPETEVTEIDFGRICLNESKSLEFNLYNKGSIELTLSELFTSENDFDIDLSTYQNKTINPSDSLLIDIDFIASEIGKKKDTLRLVTNPCEDTLLVVLSAVVETAGLRVNPDKISMNLQTGENSSESLSIKSFSTIDLEITNISLKPANPYINLQFPDGFPQTLAAGKTIDMDYVILSDNDLSYQGELCIETEGFCEADICIPFAIESFSGKIELSANALDFGYFTCQTQKVKKIINIKNGSDYADTLTKMDIIPVGEFAILNQPQLPYFMESGADIDIEIEFDIQSEGLYQAEFVISSFLLQGREIKVPLSIEYRTPLTEISSTNFDFGILERCDELQITDFTLSNRGTIADTLTYAANDLPGFSNSLESDLIIAPGSDTVITVTYDPSMAEDLGAKNYRINFSSKVCDVNLSFTANAEIIAPRLSFNPTSVDLGQVWKDFSKDAMIVIYNNSNRDREISKIELQPEINGLEFDFDLPKVIPAGETDTIYISYTALSEGTHTTQFSIEEHSVCTDITIIDFRVTVPDEYYRIDLRTGQYYFEIADPATIEVFLENPVPKFMPEGISLSLVYDTKLFHAETSYMHILGEKEEVNLTLLESGCRIDTDGFEIDSLLLQQGIIFTVEGQPLASFPLSTGLEIKDVEFITQKPYDLYTKPGMIRVQGFCEAVINNGLMSLPNMSAELVSSVNSESIKIKMKSDEPQYADICIYDLSGNEIRVQIYVDKEAEYTLSTADMSQGVYFISLSTEWGNHVASSKFLILK